MAWDGYGRASSKRLSTSPVTGLVVWIAMSGMLRPSHGSRLASQITLGWIALHRNRIPIPHHSAEAKWATAEQEYGIRSVPHAVCLSSQPVRRFSRHD